MPHYESISNICWTGGEPFLQNLDALNDLYWSLSEDGKLIECFSNGTLKYPKWATRGSQGFRPVHFIMDWKLPGTGEDLGSYWYPKSGTTADVVMANVLELLDAEGGSAFKFTIKDRKDFEEALALANIYLPSVDPPEVFAAPVWGKMDPAELVQWLLDAKVPWRLNMQVHNFVWPRDKRGT
jgi:7-carboxy-7-deazaguanine synthase